MALKLEKLYSAAWNSLGWTLTAPHSDSLWKAAISGGLLLMSLCKVSRRETQKMFQKFLKQRECMLLTKFRLPRQTHG